MMSKRPRTRETKQRRVVYETVKNTYSHPTADWIFEQVRDELPKVSLGTIYRNLGVLKEEGLVREIYGNDRRAHYDADISPHAHFMCYVLRPDHRRARRAAHRLADPQGPGGLQRLRTECGVRRALRPLPSAGAEAGVTPNLAVRRQFEFSVLNFEF